MAMRSRPWDVSGRSLGDTLGLLAGNSTELSPPLFFVLAWVSDHVFGPSAESLRVVSLAAGLATIPLPSCSGAGRSVSGGVPMDLSRGI
jgi:uncharacterized membrane protein